MVFSDKRFNSGVFLLQIHYAVCLLKHFKKAFGVPYTSCSILLKYRVITEPYCDDDRGDVID
jgi:hypothetical protein